MTPTKEKVPEPFQVPHCTCQHCRDKGTGKPFTWIPRKEGRPKECPQCKSRNWDKPPQR